MTLSLVTNRSNFSPLFSAASFLEAIPDAIEFAFQPIVNIQTGAAYGYEALLRGHERMGLTTIQSFFDHAWRLGVLHQADLLLRQKALLAFSEIPVKDGKKLFFNLDGRCFESPDYNPEQTRTLMKRLNFPPAALCLELSEQYNNSEASHVSSILERCRKQAFRLALDDYGRGFSQLKTLYDHQPDYLKIDRFFLHGMSVDDKKRLMVHNVVRMAHTLGITVIAEGVEMEADMIACRNAECDMIQGFLIQKPQTDLSQLLDRYPLVPRINSRDRRQMSKKGDKALVMEKIESLPAVKETDDIVTVMDVFQRHGDLTVLPVLDQTGHPRGLIRESRLKVRLFNRFGHALLTNKGLGDPLERLIARCPIADIDSPIEDILDIFAQSQNPDGILIVEEFQYVGLLSTQSLLYLVHEKSLEQARDQNPLTKLPGNQSITTYVASQLENRGKTPRTIAYFDFDNFKPFNDHYGFRQGDRAILLFAEILQRILSSKDIFLGHIGGDDFFVGFVGFDIKDVKNEIEKILDVFSKDIESFYDPVDLDAGFIVHQDRCGTVRRFPVMTCSVAIITLGERIHLHDQDALMTEISRLKVQAKASPSHLACEEFP